MKTNAKRILSLILSLVTVLVSFPASAFAGNRVQGFSEKDFLKTSGRDIVNQNGEKIQLKGVNLGSWLIWEDWLSPYEEASDHYDVLEKLIQRFGTEKAYALMDTYMDNWITEYDLDEIKSMGFNCVRVPFWYRNFYYDDNGGKILNQNGEWDFSRLDWIVEECSKREIYVILDMHGAPGFQSDAPHSGKAGSCGLYAKNDSGEKARTLTKELWTAIALRFKGNPAVAMYDLLNEPMCDVKAGEISRRINNEYIYTMLYDTVREADPDHIITLECIWTAIALPQPFMKGWSNVVYQVHFYQNSNFIFNLFTMLTKVIFCTVPIMMGEFYPHKKTTWDNCLKTMNKYNYNWFLWTYKASGHNMWQSDWCLRGSKDGFERAKILSDSYEEISRKWGECIRTENGFQDTGHYENDIKAYIQTQS